jgi:bacteriocin-like protein
MSDEQNEQIKPQDELSEEELEQVSGGDGLTALDPIRIKKEMDWAHTPLFDTYGTNDTSK